jgi:hypothetical protein
MKDILVRFGLYSLVFVFPLILWAWISAIWTAFVFMLTDERYDMLGLGVVDVVVCVAFGAVLVVWGLRADAKMKKFIK